MQIIWVRRGMTATRAAPVYCEGEFVGTLPYKASLIDEWQAFVYGEPDASKWPLPVRLVKIVLAIKSRVPAAIIERQNERVALGYSPWIPGPWPPSLLEDVYFEAQPTQLGDLPRLAGWRPCIVERGRQCLD